MATNCIRCGKKIGMFDGECRQFENGTWMCTKCFTPFNNIDSELTTNTKISKINTIYFLYLDILQKEDLNEFAREILMNHVYAIYRDNAQKAGITLDENGLVPESACEEALWSDVNSDESTYSIASGLNLPYVVLQVTLKEKLIGTGSANLSELEAIINAQARKGYRLHTFSTANGGSKGMMGGDRIQATMVFERLDLAK